MNDIARLKTAEKTLARQTRGADKGYKITSKVIILLTDGEQTYGRRTPLQGAELAKQWGIKIYAIGVGGTEGVQAVPSVFGQFKVAMGGGVDAAALKAVAEVTGGAYWPAGDARSLRTVYKEIDRLEKSEIEAVRYLDYRELFVIPALAALVLLLIETGLRCTWLRRLP